MSSAAIRASITNGLARAGKRTAGKALQAVIIRPGTIDETTSPPTRSATTTFTVTAMQSKFSFKEMEAGNVQSGDVKFLLEAGSVEPRNDDQIKVAGVRYEIVETKSVSPGGTALMWTIHARGGVPDNDN